jgi:hypothetical protein
MLSLRQAQQIIPTLVVEQIGGQQGAIKLQNKQPTRSIDHTGKLPGKEQNRHQNENQ